MIYVFFFGIAFGLFLSMFINFFVVYIANKNDGSIIVKPKCNIKTFSKEDVDIFVYCVYLKKTGQDNDV